MTDLLLSLQITALGMGLVFGAILFLWAMMVILTMLTADKPPGDEDHASDSASAEPISESGYKLQAAAAAVAFALAEQERSSARPIQEPPTALVSAWQLGMRTNQRSEKGNFRRH